MNAERRAVLEAITYATDDAAVSPGERLKALEQLAELDEDGEREALLALSDAELYDEVDRMTEATLVAVVAEGEDGERFPRVASRLRQEIETRVRERVRRLADGDELEARVERRAEERAREMYAARAFEVVPNEHQKGAVSVRRFSDRPEKTTSLDASGPPDAEGGGQGPAKSPQTERETHGAHALPPGLTLEDLRRPWNRGC